MRNVHGRFCTGNRSVDIVAGHQIIVGIHMVRKYAIDPPKIPIHDLLDFQVAVQLVKRGWGRFHIHQGMQVFIYRQIQGHIFNPFKAQRYQLIVLLYLTQQIADDVVQHQFGGDSIENYGDEYDGNNAEAQKNGQQLLMQRRMVGPCFQTLHGFFSPFRRASR